MEGAHRILKRRCSRDYDVQWLRNPGGQSDGELPSHGCLVTETILESIGNWTLVWNGL